jgi:hypothetical protein
MGAADGSSGIGASIADCGRRRAIGGDIAHVQRDVARHDHTGEPSALTRRIAVAHAAWSRWLRGRG